MTKHRELESKLSWSVCLLVLLVILYLPLYRTREALEEFHGGNSPNRCHRIPHMVGMDYQFCWCDKNALDIKNKVLDHYNSIVSYGVITSRPGLSGSQAAMLCGAH